MTLNSLEDLLLMKLQELYFVEKQMLRSLPKMAKAAASKDLKKGFGEHLKETRRQAERLERIFKRIGVPAKAKSDPAMVGLLEAGDAIMKMKGDEATRDAGLIAAAQGVEHHEIAGYGTAIAWADELGEGEIGDILEETIKEELAVNEKLTDMAEEAINPLAAGSEAEEEEEKKRKRKKKGGKK